MIHQTLLPKKRTVFAAAAVTIMVGIVTLQINSNISEQHTTIPLNTHWDPLLDYIDPYVNKDFCNNLPKKHPHPRRLVITEKTQDDILKVFVWRQQTYSDLVIDWNVESQTMCPFPPELQPFFDFNKEYHIKNESIVWEQGHAPCWFWGNSRGVVKGCGGVRNLKYIETQDYTEFRDADIIFMDYPYYNYINKAPFWDYRRMPPRIAHQKWVFYFLGESIGYYPHVALPSFLQQFDLTMGSPGPLFDIPYPLYSISEDQALKMANVQPQVPFDKKPDHYIAWVVSNCAPKNDRNEWMQEMIDKIGAHSYGKCLHNKDFPTDMDDTTYNYANNYDNKNKILSTYPFTFVAENSDCLAYVTEKIYHALEIGAIPIYMGAKDITDYVPEGSYINTLDFENATQLVEFMRTVDRAPYYEWKKVVKKDVTQFCKSCFHRKGTIECNFLDRAVFL